MATKPVIINLHGACENHCVFCFDSEGEYFHPDLGPRKTLDVTKEIVAAIKTGSRELKLTGSEPLNHPHILEVLRFAQQGGVRSIQIDTSGRKLRDRNFLRALITAGVTTFVLPIYGSVLSKIL